METIAIVCSPGVGDALIFHIAAHHLRKAGFEVALSTPHHFGRWLPDYSLADPKGCDAIFLQHGNGPAEQEVSKWNKPVYTFYGSHRPGKHPPLKPGFDYVCDPNMTMADNVAASLSTLFGIAATKDNGLKPFPGLLHRRNKKRVALHTVSSQLHTQWPQDKYLQLAQWLRSEGFEPAILPQFPTLEDLTSFLYESGYFIGNDSGPGHIASCLQIPHLIIGRCARHMKFWRPGWTAGEIVTPPKWVPNWSGFRLRETHWKQFVTVKKVINRLKISLLKR